MSLTKGNERLALNNLTSQIDRAGHVSHDDSILMCLALPYKACCILLLGRDSLSIARELPAVLNKPSEGHLLKSVSFIIYAAQQESYLVSEYKLD